MVDYEEELDRYLDEIKELARSKQYARLRDLFLPMEPADIALLLEESGGELMPLLYRLLPKELAAEVFVELESDSQEMLINGFSNTELKEVLDELYLDDAVDIVEEMPASVVIRILDKATPEMRKSINEILKETINVCYVIDDWRHLIGVLSIRTLLLAEEDDLIEDIMDPNVVWVSTMDDKEDAAQALSKYGFLAMPVVDLENRLVGIVTVDDAMDVLTEAAAEDLSIMAAVTPDEKPYFAASAWEHARHRVVWLLILMLSAAITGSIITRYEDAISAVPLLVAFLPMLMDTGGNCGSQSATLVIRGLALEEIRPRDALRVIRKELAVAAIVSAVLAAANGLRIYLQYHDSAIALVISLSLAATVVLAKLVGCMLPIAAKQLHMDPAIMASPLITTIVDAGAVLIYFQAAAALLRLPV